MLLSILSLQFCIFGNPKFIINFLVAKLNNIKYLFNLFFVSDLYNKKIYLNLLIEDTNIWDNEGNICECNIPQI